MPAVPPEVILEQYQLKSSFFFEKLSEFGYFDFFYKLNKIIQTQGDTFDWSEKGKIGISNEAWNKISKTRLHPLQIFCSPRILRQHPSLLRYYRSIAMLPQKGLQNISKISSIKAIENGKRPISEKNIIVLVVTLNEFISSIILLSDEINKEKISGMMYATGGTTIDGSWRNQIGNEGERVIRTVVVKSLVENSEVIAISAKNDISYSLREWNKEIGPPIETVNKMKSVIVKNGSTMLFSSEPDITFIDAKGNIVGATEIKAGIDPAGALERLGAMFKSFDNVLSITPNATTILIATCITPEVDSRLRESNTVTQTYITTDIINNKSGKATKFSNTVRSILGLIKKRM